MNGSGYNAVILIVSGFVFHCVDTVNTVTSKEVIKDYCQGGAFEARCSQNEVILMTHAQYGRMREGNCVDAAYGNVGCSKNILPLMDQKCSGQQACQVLVSDLINDKIDFACPKDLTSYLEAAYTCIEVVAAKSNACMGSPVLALSSSGHLASKLTHDTRIGSSSCPWALHVPKGQTINITLYDFGVHDAKLTTGQYFPKYFVIKEPAITKEATVYAGSERVRRVYSSTSNELQIDIFDKTTPKTLTNFIILYQAVGCSDPVIPPHSSLERTGSTQAKVTCEHTGNSWKLTCEDHSWLGKLGNCSMPVFAEEETTVWMILFGEDWSSPSGILIVIGFGIALGIIIGLVLLAVAIVCMKRMKYFDAGNKMESSEGNMIGEDPSSPCKFSMETDTHQLSSTYQEPLVRDSVQRVYADGVYRASLTSQDSWPRTAGGSSGQRSKYFTAAPVHIYETPDNTSGCHS